MAVRNYQDLIAWQKAMEFAERVYRVTAGFPSDEKFGLTSQVRRAAVSIPSNIAEGQGRFSDQDFRRFLSIAHGSLREAETQLLLSKRLGYCTDDAIAETLSLGAEVGRLIQGLANKLKAE
jgi:four helix bundle protein